MKIKIFLFLFFFLVFASFFIQGFKTIESDFYWHLRNGQTILTSGFFYKDLYSYTMPSFPVVSHSWLSEVLFALIYKPMGFYGLSFIFSTLFLGFLGLYFLFFQKNFSLKFLKSSSFWRLSVLIFSITVFFGFFLVRPQIISWSLWGILVAIISNKKIFQKYRLSIPILFLIWSNFHGEFGLGIATLLFVTFFSIIQTRKVDFTNLIISFLSILATLINPYGVNLWREVFSTYFSPYLRSYISEWQPIFFSYFDLSFLFLTVFSSFLVWRYKKHFDIKLIFLYFILLVQAFLSIKNIPLWVIFNFVIVYKGIYLIYKYLPNKISIERFKKAGVFVFSLSVVLFMSQVFMGLRQDFYSPILVYPTNAISFLKSNLPKGQIFSDYSLGGYLIYNLPQKKVFVDGRMGVWEWNGNIPNETNNAFRDYLNLLSGDIDFNQIFEKYNITTVLWPKQDPQDPSGYKFSRYFCKYIHLNLCKFVYEQGFGEKLIKKGWKIVYSDNASVIYQRSHSY